MESKVNLTFDKSIYGISVFNARNEKCNGKVCSFTYKFRNPLNKGQKLKFLHRIGLESPGHVKMMYFQFNGETICEN